MRIRPGLILVIAGVFAVLFGGRYLGWFGKKSAPPPEQQSSASTSPPEQTATPTISSSATAPGPAQPTVPLATTPKPNRTAAVPAPAATSTPATPPVIAEWEQRIDDVLTGKEDENLKAKRLLDIFPQLPEEGQVEAAQHLSNLLPDEQYPALAQTLTNAHTSEAVLDVLMTDVLNRPNSLKLGTLLDIVHIPGHPKAEEARDILEVFVETPCGDDWECWKQGVKKFLSENPEE